MSRIVAVLSVLSLAACPADHRVDELDLRVATVEKRLDAVEVRRPKKPARPDPNTTYRVPVGADEPYRGAAHAPVTLVDIYEYACPYCARIAPVMDALVEKYGDDLKIVSKPFVVHPDVATLPALAACAANEQGHFVELEDELWKRAWPNDRLDKKALSKPALTQIAGDIGLNLTRFVADMDGSKCRAALARERRTLSAIGVRGTPSLFINGRPYVGARTVDGFAQVIDAELAKAKASGTPVAEYYDQLMAKARPRL